jgi:hypothetical protein
LALASRTFCRDLHHIYFTIGKFNEHVEVLNSVERIYIMYKCIVGGIKYHPTSPGREYYFIDSLGQPWLLWNADAKYGGLQCMKNGLWKSYADTSTWNNHSRQHMNIIITLM